MANQHQALERNSDDEIRRKNIKTAGVLLSVVLVFLLGFVAKIALFGAS